MNEQDPISIPPIVPPAQAAPTTPPKQITPAVLAKAKPTGSSPAPVATPSPATDRQPPTPPARGLDKARERINTKEIFFRSAAFLLLTVSLFLAWWSFNQLAARQLEVKELNSKLSKINREIDALQNGFTEAQTAEVNRKYDAAKKMLLPGDEGVTDWWRNLQDQAAKLSLQLGEPKLQPMNTFSNQLGIAAATLSIDVQPTPGVYGIETPYQRLLRLSQHLATLDTRCDMPELIISGGSNSFSKATMLINLWALREGEVQ